MFDSIQLMKIEKFRLFSSRGQNIIGIHYQNGEKSRGVAVLQHGWGGTKESETLKPVNEALLEKGFETYI